MRAFLLGCVALWSMASFGAEEGSFKITCLDYVSENASSSEDSGVTQYSVLDYTQSKDSFENVSVAPIFGRERTAAVYNGNEDELDQLTVQVAFVDPLVISNNMITFSSMYLDGNFHFTGAMIPKSDGSAMGMYVFGCAKGEFDTGNADEALSKFKNKL